MVKRYRLDTECIIDMEEGKVLSMVQIRNKLNKLNDENVELNKENLKLLGLLGDIRALARLNDTDTIIEKINKLEKEVMWND